MTPGLHRRRGADPPRLRSRRKGCSAFGLHGRRGHEHAERTVIKQHAAASLGDVHP